MYIPFFRKVLCTAFRKVLLYPPPRLRSQRWSIETTSHCMTAAEPDASFAEASADVVAAADAALKAPTLPEKDGRARLHALISSLRARGTGEAGVNVSRVQVINGERLRKLLVSLRQLLCGREPKLRPVALRVLRYLCHTDEAIVLMREEFLDIFVARSLEREAVHMQERAAALRIFDHLAILQPKSLTASLMVAVVAVAEHAGDPLRNVRTLHMHCVCTPYALHGSACALQRVHGECACKHYVHLCMSTHRTHAPLAQVCLNSLRTLAVRDVSVMAAHNALPTLLHAVVPEVEDGQVIGPWRPLHPCIPAPLHPCTSALLSNPHTLCPPHSAGR